MITKHWGVIAALSLIVGACQPLTELPYDRSTASVKSIGIVTPVFPTEPVAALASTVGQSFGLIGALVDMGMNADRVDRLEKVLAEQHFAAQQIFLERLTSALQAEGYTVTAIAVPRNQQQKLLATYPPRAETKVDAYLDMYVGEYGYFAAGISDSTPYRPHFTVHGRLVRSDNASVLMEDSVVYNPLGQATNIITISPDPAAQYTTFNLLIADPVGATKRLRTAEEQSADAFAKLLK